MKNIRALRSFYSPQIGSVKSGDVIRNVPDFLATQLSESGLAEFDGNKKQKQAENKLKPEFFSGESVVIVATGPSLTTDDVDFCVKSGAKMICINDAWRLCQDAFAMYACDFAFWHYYGDEINRDFRGKKYTQCAKSAKKYGLNHVFGENKPGLGLDCIHFGNNSGYQAINLAFLLGAKKIALLGFDCKNDENGKAHYFGQHPQKLNQRQPFDIWLSKYPQLADDLQKNGVDVVNCSRDTAITCFKRDKIQNVIAN